MELEARCTVQMPVCAPAPTPSSVNKVGAGLAWAILDALPKPTLIISEDGRVHYGNREAELLFALERSDLAQASCTDLLGAGLDLPTLFERAQSQSMVPARLPNGCRVTLEVDLSQVPETTSESASQRLWVLSIRDISAFDKLKQERDRLLRLASAGAQMPTLLHELRKPLANLSAVLEGVEMVGGPPDPKLVQALLVETRRMSLMIETTGASVRALRTRCRCRVDQDLRECRSLLARVAWRRGVALDWVVDDMPSLPLDPGVLRSILCNLIANALDACEPGDRIEVRAEVRDDGAGNTSFEMMVRDSGAGMSEETLRRCTEPFYSTKTGGSGIGLALCRDILEGGGGRLEIESTPQHGTPVHVSVFGV